MVENIECPCCQLSKEPIVKSTSPTIASLENGQSKLEVLEVPRMDMVILL